MTTDTDPTLCSGEYADAPFCAGPSDQGEAVPELAPPQTLDREPVERPGFGSVFDACGPDGIYLDVATGTGTYRLVIGDRVETFTVTEVDTSESLGLSARGFGDVDLGDRIEFSHDGETIAEGIVQVECGGVTVPVGDTITEAPATPAVAVETLPEAGGPFAVLFVASAGLAALGAALVRLGRR